MVYFFWGGILSCALTWHKFKSNTHLPGSPPCTCLADGTDCSRKREEEALHLGGGMCWEQNLHNKRTVF